MSIFEDLYLEEKSNYISTIKELKLKVENLQEKLFEKEMLIFSKEYSYSFNEIRKAVANGNDFDRILYHMGNTYDLIEEYGIKKFLDYFRRVEFQNEENLY